MAKSIETPDDNGKKSNFDTELLQVKTMIRAARRAGATEAEVRKASEQALNEARTS